MIRTADALEHVMDGGGLLRETLIHDPEEKTIWTHAETGETVHGQAVRLLRSRRPFIGMADGLFGEHQTYRIGPQ